MKNKTLVVTFAILFFIIASVAGVISYVLIKDDNEEINSYEECVEAGNPILETYPEQCKTPDGKTFTRQLTQEEQDNLDSGENTDYYGSSTFSSCNADSDCIVSGCNMEICQGINEELMSSICLAPAQDTPTQAGYKCGCSASNKCQWQK